MTCRSAHPHVHFVKAEHEYQFPPAFAENSSPDHFSRYWADDGHDFTMTSLSLCTIGRAA